MVTDSHFKAHLPSYMRKAGPKLNGGVSSRSARCQSDGLSARDGRRAGWNAKVSSGNSVTLSRELDDKVSEDENFRTRTARERRRRTGSRILESVFSIIDAEGIAAINIDRVRNAAHLSRGSFYNYSSTVEDMLINISRVIGKQVDREQIEYFSSVKDPVVKLSSYQRYGVARVGSDKACACILLRTLPITGTMSSEMHARMVAEFAEALRLGKIDVPSVEVAVDMGMGMVIAMLRQTVLHGVDMSLIDVQSTMVFRALGVSKRIASTLASAPTPKQPETALRLQVIEAGLD